MGVAEAAGVGAALALISRTIALTLHWPWFSQGFVGDSSVHWVIVRTLRRRPRARWIDEYLISPEPMSYPTGFHRLAALFPLRIVETRPWLPNLALWTIAIAGYAAYVDYAARSLLHAAPTWMVIGSLAFALIVPSSVLFQGPAIAYLKLSERLLGRLATAFAVLFLAVGTAADDRPSLAAAAGCAAIGALSSVFARQALLFGLPLLALAWVDWRPLAVLAAAIGLALAVGRARFVQGVRHMWIQWHLYVTHTKASGHVHGALSHLATRGSLVSALRDREALNRLVFEREPLRAVVTYPEILVVACALAAGSAGLGWRWAAPVVAFAALYVATSSERLNHLGEAYRYLEFGLFLVVPLTLARATATWPALARVALVLGLACWSTLLAVRIFVRGRWRRSLPASDALSTFLERVSLRPGDVVYPVSMRLGADVCARVEGVRSFWWQPGIVAESIYDEFIEEYPYLKRDYRPLVERYAVTHVIAEKAALAQLGWSYDFSGLSALAEDERYLAFVVPRPTVPTLRPMKEAAR